MEFYFSFSVETLYEELYKSPAEAGKIVNLLI